jgi:hypothetical protein
MVRGGRDSHLLRTVERSQKQVIVFNTINVPDTNGTDERVNAFMEGS